MTTPRTSPRRSRLFPAALLTALIHGTAPAQGPCLDLSPNDTYDDQIMSSAHYEDAILVTNGPNPLTIHYIECFTGESNGLGRLGIRTYDPALNHPGPLVSTGTWRLRETKSWQGAVLDTPVTVAANQRFWVTKLVDAPHQSSIMAYVGRGIGSFSMTSTDGGQHWSGPFDSYEKKYRFFC